MSENGNLIHSVFSNTSFKNTSSWTTHTLGGTATYLNMKGGAYSEMAITITTVQSGYYPEARVRGFEAMNAKSEIPVPGAVVHASNNSGTTVNRRWVGRWPFVSVQSRGNVSGGSMDLKFEVWQGTPIETISQPDQITYLWTGTGAGLTLAAPDLDREIDLLGAKEVAVQLAPGAVAAGAATFTLDVLTSPDNVTWDTTSYVTLISAQAKSTVQTKPLSVDARYVKFRLTVATANMATDETCGAIVGVKY
jgi:hypothetical protein